MEEKLKIINSFDLQVEEVEPTVYKVINTDKEVNIHKLQWALEECVLFTSERIRWEQLETGINTAIANVYYILLTFDNRELISRYDKVACNEQRKVYLRDYKCRPDRENSIDTIYREDEI